MLNHIINNFTIPKQMLLRLNIYFPKSCNLNTFYCFSISSLAHTTFCFTEIFILFFLDFFLNRFHIDIKSVFISCSIVVPNRLKRPHSLFFSVNCRNIICLNILLILLLSSFSLIIIVVVAAFQSLTS